MNKHICLVLLFTQLNICLENIFAFSIERKSRKPNLNTGGRGLGIRGFDCSWVRKEEKPVNIKGMI